MGIEYTRTPVYMASAAMNSPIGRSHSPLGAPVGPYHPCAVRIIPKSGSQPLCDGAQPATVKEGTYKFSIFGARMGRRGTIGLPGGYPPQFFASRIKLTIAGNDSATVSFQSSNRKSYSSLAALGNRDVRSMTITSSEHGVIKIAFPLEYNIGQIVSGSLTDVATKTLKVRASQVEDGFHLDFIFPIYDLAVKDRWFLYDPDITASSNPNEFVAIGEVRDDGFDLDLPKVAVMLFCGTLAVALLCIMSLLSYRCCKRFYAYLHSGQIIECRTVGRTKSEVEGDAWQVECEQSVTVYSEKICGGQRRRVDL